MAPLLETDKCLVCGTTVKKENLKGHYEKVHPKRVGVMTQPKTFVKPASFFRSHRRRNIAVLSLVVLAVIGVSIVAARMIDASTMKMHVHPELSATINGSPFTIPAQIGIDGNLWRDHSLDQYGMQGMSPLHTHDSGGTLHVESNTVRDFTLRELLAVWGESIDEGKVLGHTVDPGHRAYILVDGVEKPATQDVVFSQGLRIQMVCGP